MSLVFRVSLLLYGLSCITGLAQLGPTPGGPFRPEGREPGLDRGPRPESLGASLAELGSAGIVWYPILQQGLAEARRMNKPVLFMSVASQCGGISGVF